MKVLITGTDGFIGKNLIARLESDGDHELLKVTRDSSWPSVVASLSEADFVVHLAGVNRPTNDHEFLVGNVEFTARLCDELSKSNRKVPIIFSSSIQAVLDNPYGKSKRKAEQVIERYAESTGALAIIYRLKNVFGKWCRPNYNSVVATFCHNIARDLPISITNPERKLDLVYIDDVIHAFIEDIGESESALREPSAGIRYGDVSVSYTTSLRELATTITSFRDARSTLLVPDHGDQLIHKLYATYLSYLEPDDFAYDLDQRVDPRGSLAEFVKSEGFGQIFVSRTKPGITRGNHYHHTKTEKFLVLEGEAVVRFRHYFSGDILEYHVSGVDYRVIDIPPGYTHSIENVGETELVTLFWASEIFDSTKPDTYVLPVIQE